MRKYLNTVIVSHKKRIEPIILPFSLLSPLFLATLIAGVEMSACVYKCIATIAKIFTEELKKDQVLTEHQNILVSSPHKVAFYYKKKDKGI